MNDLMELERDLGPELRRTLQTIIPTDASAFAGRVMEETPITGDAAATVSVGIEDRRSLITNGRLRGAGIAAAIIVIGGVGGIVTVVDRGRSPTTGVRPAITQPEATDSSTGPNSVEPTAPAGSSSATTVPLPDPENPPGVYLPTAPLAGFSLADISVDHSQPGRPGSSERNSLSYVRRDANGVDVAAMLTLTGKPTTVADDFSGKQPPLLVHGLPAHIFDSGEGIVSSWQENGVDASVRGWGVSWDDVASLAEQTAVDPSNFTVTLPPSALQGFEPSISDTHPPADAVSTNLYFVADDPRPGAFVSVANSPNDDLMSLDSIEVSLRLGRWTIDRAEVHQLPAIVATSIAGEFGPLTDVSWIEDGYLFTVTGRADKGDLMALADGLRAATVEQARQLRASLDTARFALPELDRSTLPNGFDLSVRTTGTGANVICMYSPIQRCLLPVSESSLVGDYQHAVTGTFWVDGVAWLVGWASGTHSPHVVAGGHTGDPIADVAVGASGTFLAVQFVDDSTQVKFDPSDQTMYGSGSPTQPGLLG